MHYIIQDNLFKEFHYKTLIEYLGRYGLTHETVPFIPFSNEIPHTYTGKDVFFFGSVNGAKTAVQYNWFPGSLYNENHDITVQLPYYGDNMLNANGFIIKVGDPLPQELPYTFFARPTKDTKSFSGQLFTHDSWKEYIIDLADNSMFQQLKKETEVQVVPLKNNIQQEIRCWIVNGEPVTISQYKIGERVNYLNMDNNQEAQIFARNMCKLYRPARAFVMDICLYENEYKIVEINCINCSGFYDGDMSKLLQALEKEFKS